MEKLIGYDEIQKVTKDIAGSLVNTKNSVFICLLNGGFQFFTDLVREIETPIECEFLRVKSYMNKRKQGDVIITKDIETKIKGKDVFIVDDFYDSGRTMKVVVEYLNLKEPNSINIVTLLKRKVNKVEPLVPLYYGIEVDDEWVVGYGCDNVDGYYRNLKDIYSV